MFGLNSLMKKTGETLEMLAPLPQLSSFVMVGGSALAIYLNHRLSEDIDLFTFSEIDLNLVFDEISSEINDVKLITKSINQYNIVLNNTKLTLRKEKWDISVDSKQLIGAIRIADLKVLAIMKVNTLFLRAKYRDYYDLYVLNKDIFSLKELYDLSKDKIVGLSEKLFQQALVFTDDILDDNIGHLNPKLKVSMLEITKHFENEIKKINKIDEINKKI